MVGKGLEEAQRLALLDDREQRVLGAARPAPTRRSRDGRPARAASSRGNAACSRNPRQSGWRGSLRRGAPSSAVGDDGESLGALGSQLGGPGRLEAMDRAEVELDRDSRAAGAVVGDDPLVAVEPAVTDERQRLGRHPRDREDPAADVVPRAAPAAAGGRLKRSSRSTRSPAVFASGGARRTVSRAPARIRGRRGAPARDGDAIRRRARPPGCARARRRVLGVRLDLVGERLRARIAAQEDRVRLGFGRLRGVESPERIAAGGACVAEHRRLQRVADEHDPQDLLDEAAVLEQLGAGAGRDQEVGRAGDAAGVGERRGGRRRQRRGDAAQPRRVLLGRPVAIGAASATRSPRRSGAGRGGEARGRPPNRSRSVAGR